jgi:hypothetical protein
MATIEDRRLDEPVLRYVRRDICPFRTGQSVGEAIASLRAQGVGERLVNLSGLVLR